MIQLSLSAINARSPYLLRESPMGGFDFETDAGLTYNIALIEDHTFGNNYQTYMLNVLPLSMEEYYLVKEKRIVRKRHDIKIRQVVVAVLEELYKNKNVIVSYVCLTDDRRQSSRLRLFKKWFDEYENNDKFCFLQTTMEDENMMNHFGVILSKENSQYDSFLALFHQFDNNLHSNEPLSVDGSDK